MHVLLIKEKIKKNVINISVSLYEKKLNIR